ncbi:COMM domain-containing protein 2 [Dendroctonus ponderosae]
MLISLRGDHKEHLKLLLTQPESVVSDFCKLALAYMEKGPNAKLYKTAASKLNLPVDDIQNCVYGLVNLLLIACKHQLSDADFRDSVLTLGFTEQLQAVLSEFYKERQAEVLQVQRTGLVEPHYHDLQWRFEVQVASRALPQQVTPLVTMDLALRTEQSGADPNITHTLLQTDPTNLMHLANELQAALDESRSRHCRKIHRILTNRQLQS